ncbi:MAG TPA: MarR family winged helix-turn-helix transcriptional regulator [Ktedonosporobacter sp.]|nr:MarR family winged helix-turn-helix transcriptional regulator [Ktedonosporobacter sp.]
MKEKLDTRAVRRCACVNIRQTDRVITRFYDEMLAPSGLYAPQFGLLATIAEAGPVTINGLAEIMDMDRTTLTRNLGVLGKEHLVSSEEGEDRRTRVVTLTEEGEEALRRAWPLWQEAQARIEQAFGSERFDELLGELAEVRGLAR